MKGFSVVKTHTVSVLARPSEVWAFSSISEEKNKIKFVLIWHCYIIEEKNFMVIVQQIVVIPHGKN